MGNKSFNRKRISGLKLSFGKCFYGLTGFCGLTGRTDFRLGGLLLLPVLFLLSSPSPAGTVFMKNGYIIQGTVVEHSNDSVVLGWNNGKVTIYRRFVDRVDLDPSEERAKAAVPAPSAPEDEVVVSSPNPEEELPSNLSELVRGLGLNPVLVENRIGPAVGAAKPADGTDPTSGPAAQGTNPISVEVVSVPATPEGGEKPAPTEGATVEPVQPSQPEGGVGDPASAVAQGFFLRAPGGWNRAHVQGCVNWTSPAGATGFAPSINVTSIERGTLRWEDACTALREDQKSPLQSYELVAEGSVQVGGKNAYRVAGKGSVTGETPEKSQRVSVQQYLVQTEERFWLLSTFAEGESQPDVTVAIAAAVESFTPEK